MTEAQKVWCGAQQRHYWRWTYSTKVGTFYIVTTVTSLAVIIMFVAKVDIDIASRAGYLMSRGWSEVYELSPTLGK
jgi:hypothetical protein